MNESELQSSDSVLTRYFQELANHQVMSPDEELECAQALEAAEVEHWVALLSYVPIAEPILQCLEQDIVAADEANQPDLPQVEELKKLIHAFRKQRSRLNVTQQQHWNNSSKELGRCIRLLDSDRVWMAHALRVGEQTAQVARSRSVSRENLAQTQYIARARKTDLLQQQAKTRFIKANLRLVVAIARRHDRGRLPLLDLIQEGNIGLIKAIERFDHTRGYRFSTYATWWIRHSVRRALADKGRTIRIPVHMLDIFRCMSRAALTIVSRTGREPTLEELETDTGISKKKLAQAQEFSASRTLSLDRPIGDENGRRFVDLLAEENSPSPFDRMVQQTWSREMQLLLGTLTPIETRIIRWRFGLDDDVELTLKEIGDKYGLSRERIRQIQEQAICKLRKQVGDSWL
jgi:RNA polymerase primary sigma factor